MTIRAIQSVNPVKCNLMDGVNNKEYYSVAFSQLYGQRYIVFRCARIPRALGPIESVFQWFAWNEHFLEHGRFLEHTGCSPPPPFPPVSFHCFVSVTVPSFTFHMGAHGRVARIDHLWDWSAAKIIVEVPGCLRQPNSILQCSC